MHPWLCELRNCRDPLIITLLRHLPRQHPRLLFHLFQTSRLPTLIINRREFRPSSSGASTCTTITTIRLQQLALNAADIPFLPFKHRINGIRTPVSIQVRLPARNHMRMDMRHALARIDAVLNGDVEARRTVHPLDHPRHFTHRQKQVRGFGWRKVRNARDDAVRAYEDMAREDWFEVHESKGERGLVKDLLSLFPEWRQRFSTLVAGFWGCLGECEFK
ncbi:hypothetical protein VTN31DRAFT_4334 [Thermomyces dupontii]|uniref:uncharacterized protein n=1 Tax=Talaromyces thermophilus TaxID=28565 RepID=UPI003743E836